MKTLFISDLDGTLLQPNVELSGKTIDTINSLIDRGMLFSVATARTIASVRSILRDIKVTVPIILMNGVCIYDLGRDDYRKVETFSENSNHLLLSVIRSHHLKGFAYSIKNGVLSTYYEDLSSKALHDFYQERVDRYQKKFIQVDSFSSLAEEPLIYFSLIDTKENLQDIYHIIEQIPDLNCTFYKDNYSPDLWYLETFSKTASKYHAVQYLRSSQGFDKVVCFGDNRNDLPLFEASDYKIAVGNAVDELKHKADLVIGKNYEDGVAEWLKDNFSRF
jgi:Cof subfamily protein (haloacid dehalogenase superfamily)